MPKPEIEKADLLAIDYADGTRVVGIVAAVSGTEGVQHVRVILDPELAADESTQ
jgi:hypothetical protein